MMERKMGGAKRLGAALGLCACSGMDTPELELSGNHDEAPAGATTTEQLGSAQAAIVRGQTEDGRNYVMNLRIEYQSVNANGVLNVGFCSSILFAPRVLLTAAHCLNPVRTTADGGSFVDQPLRIMAYMGSSFAADFAALGPDPAQAIPSPPAASRFMLADSWETHPSWDVATLFPDLAVVYLDRKPLLPPNTIVDPLPVGRTRLGAAEVGKLFTIVGYGASRALSADITQVEGAGIKRRGTQPFVGAPITNPLPADPHPGIQLTSVRSGLFQLNGRSPNSNGCAGDSGGPAIRNVGGQDYVFGIGSWVGNFCEDFSYFTRLDPFLPFIDESYRKGGQAPTTAALECVTTRPEGGYRAYFGHRNDNGVVVEVPYGPNNAFARDTAGRRPTRFEPGRHPFAFGVNFSAGQTLSWRLAPTNSPTSQVNASATSPACDTSGRQFICAQACDAVEASGCGQTYAECQTGCLQFYSDVGTCESYIDEYHRCVARALPANFECFDGFPFAPECAPALEAIFTECLDG